MVLRSATICARRASVSPSAFGMTRPDMTPFLQLVKSIYQLRRLLANAALDESAGGAACRVPQRQLAATSPLRGEVKRYLPGSECRRCTRRTPHHTASTATGTETAVTTS